MAMKQFSRPAGRPAAWLAAATAIFGGCTEADRPLPDPFVQDGPGFYQELSWSPDGSSLLVSVLEITDGDPGFAYRVWSLDPDLGTAAPITDGPGDYWTSWSPGGDRVVFAGDGEGGALDLFTMRADGSGLAPLTVTAAGETQPDWSPDGERIAFIAYRDDRAQLWTMRSDGESRTLVLAPAGEPQNPEWSPDGARIAFYETDGAGTDRIVIVGTDGSDPTVVGEGLWPTWTPDGESILYGGAGGLYRLDLSGGEPVLIVPGDVLAGELSRDGRRLAYIVQSGDSISVVVSDPDGGHGRTAMTRPRPQW